MQLNGKDILIYPNGRKYDGDWINNKKEGKGKEYWPNGDYYIGEYKNDLFNSRGIYYDNSTGDKYDGGWKDLRKHGKGILHCANGSNVTQYWINNQLTDVLASNILIDELLNQGFKTVYDQLYSHQATGNELTNVKSQCNPNSIICDGGADGYNTLLLVSCGSCLDIVTTTPENQPRLVNGAWWYFTPDKSFGFAPNSTINQIFVDKFDCDRITWSYCKDSNRLSWYLNDDGWTGWTGWRLGTPFICY